MAALIEPLRRTRGASPRKLVNEGLCQGLKIMDTPKRNQTPLRTTSVDLGPCLLGNVDNVAEILAIAEGESFR